MIKILICIYSLLHQIQLCKSTDLFGPTWGYECINGICERFKMDNSHPEAISLSVCRLNCGDNVPGTLWPKPSGNVSLSMDIISINPSAINVAASMHPDFWHDNEKRFLHQIKMKIPKKVQFNMEIGIKLKINVLVKSPNEKLTMDTNESYLLNGKELNGIMMVNIEADTMYGARHGLETLSQLIVYDDLNKELKMPSTFSIEDGPVYKHRGLILDTGRNYFSVDAIKRTIDAMAMVKMNTFHWHIIDSQSFPLVLESQPELARLGAYSPDKIYTIEDVNEILEWAKIRGVRVLPEFDAPAHVGEGWQSTGLTACFNYKPWEHYCVEPPCGQLDPSKGELYDILENIYREMIAMFRQPDVFHMGGDEVSVACWNSSANIRQWMLNRKWKLDESDFIRLWGHFQENALKRFDAHHNDPDVPIILWTSRLTEQPFAKKYLDNKRYIIQIWTKGDDPQVEYLLKEGYRLIMSNVDALYFDCGFESWVGEGSNWCAPFIGWHKVYENNLAGIGGQYKEQIIGAEAALWSEQADDTVVDNRFWPRASAMAERLWSDPSTSWREAEPRMLLHRDRLVENGIAAGRLQPEWCLHHEGQCPAKN